MNHSLLAPHVYIIYINNVEAYNIVASSRFPSILYIYLNSNIPLQLLLQLNLFQFIHQPVSSLFTSMAVPSPSSLIGTSLHLAGARINRKSSSSAVVSFRQPQTVIAAYTSTGSGKTGLTSDCNTQTSSSLYEVLGIPMTATCHEIKAAYRRLARMCHPDVANINEKNKSASEFIKIHAAYSTLSDPIKRACYDREVFSRQRVGKMVTVSTASGFPGYVRRNWETDQCW